MGHKHGGFNCLQCKNCCALLVIPITETDFNRLFVWKEKKSIPDKEFFTYFTFGSYDNVKIPQLILRSPCPFITEKGCKIYPFRPDVCKKYPFEVQESSEVEVKDRLLERRYQNGTLCLSIQHKNCPATKKEQKFSSDYLNKMFDVNIRYDLDLEKAIESKFSWFHKKRQELGVDEQLKPTDEEMFKALETDYEVVENKMFLFDKDVSQDLRPKLMKDFLPRENVPTVIQLFEKGYEKRIMIIPMDLYSKLIKKIMETSKNYFKGSEKILLFGSFQGIPLGDKFDFLQVKWDKVILNDFNIREAIEKNTNLFDGVSKF